ncbi:MAG: ABC transporter substrate-binding protein [Candidatus Poribacteria bacterium]|nr:ABC transporter substrate-binding protein [Candidatus Poribacteria bacterium]MDE0502887.1 ABC transporter substrate-binding protein [Candidatus Poribacteria bacterium]
MIKPRIDTLATVVMIIGFITGLCGCDLLADYLVTADGGSAASDPGSFHSVTMDIGLVAPLTGDYADSLGVPILNGFNLARDEIKLYPDIPVQINFIIEDDMGTVDGAVGAFERLIEAGVPAILGPAISTHAKEAFPIAQENRVVAFSSLSSAAGLSSVGDFIFRAALAVDKLSPAGVKATHAQLGYKKVAMIYDNADVWSTSSNEYLTAALEGQGVEVVTTQTIQTGDVDFSGQLEAIMETEPDVLFISALPPEMVKIMIQGRKTGIDAQYIVSQMSMHEVEQAGDAAEGAITVVGWHIDAPANLHFVDSYRAAYGIDPDPWAAQAYATFFILYAAIVEAESMDATAIRDALALTEDFDTNLGSFSFDENGEAVYDPVVLVVKDGMFEMFGTTDEAKEDSSEANDSAL